MNKLIKLLRTIEKGCIVINTNHSKIKLLLLPTVLLLINSCSYCFLEKSYPHHKPRDLAGANSREVNLCCAVLTPNNNKGIQANLYYGNLSLESSNSNAENHTMPFGEFGFRIEKYVAPGKFFPVNILGLGLDYAYGNNYNMIQHRVMFSTNLIFLVKRNIVGYASLQAGIRYNEVENQSKFTNEFAYRNALGLQYYFAKKMAFVTEVGYGNGANIRVGINKWF